MKELLREIEGLQDGTLMAHANGDVTSIKQPMKFIEYLAEVHANDYIGVDDDMPDDFDNWPADMDIEECMDYAQKWHDGEK